MTREYRRTNRMVDGLDQAAGDLDEVKRRQYPHRQHASIDAAPELFDKAGGK